MRWLANLPQRRVWFQVHVVDGENEVVALGAEIERIFTRYFELIIKNVLVSKKGKGG